ncbi:MAG: nitrite/sulfite reductase [Pelobacteraceae bacterium]
MSQTGSEYRLDGIYQQRQSGFFMQRVKLAAGVISAQQARTVAAVAERFGRGTLHLTSRGSIEIHWLAEEVLQEVKRELAQVGLTSRGACGGAVRGVTCGSQRAQGFPLLETVAMRLHCHFTGNPRFERLPKKFKIGIEADVSGGRHLIQDAGLVLAKVEDGRAWFDVWIAGGLGREPRPGFLLAESVAEERLIPIIEAVLAVYATHAPPPKRLKFLAQEFGQEELVRLIKAEAGFSEELPPYSGLSSHLVPHPGGRQRLEVPLFAGNLASNQLHRLADFADACADNVLMVTTNQDIAFLLAEGVHHPEAAEKLWEQAGFSASEESCVTVRVCPGNHECRMGLAATRDVAADILAAAGNRASELTLALCGCPNSCTQPQLADVGIVAARLVAADDGGGRVPRFDIYRRNGAGLGQKVLELLTQEEMVEKVKDLLK